MSKKDIGFKDFMQFFKVLPARSRQISRTPDAPIRYEFGVNKLAKKLHPEKQFLKVASVTDHGDAKSYKLVPDPSRGTDSCAFFRAGQYLSVQLSIDGARAASRIRYVQALRTL